MDYFAKALAVGIVSLGLVACGGSSSTSGEPPVPASSNPAQITPQVSVVGLEPDMEPLQVQLNDDQDALLDITFSGEYAFDSSYMQDEGTEITLHILADSPETCRFKQAKTSNKQKLTTKLQDAPVLIDCAATPEESASSESSNEKFTLTVSDLVDTENEDELLGLVSQPLSPKKVGKATITLTDAEGEPLAYHSVFVNSEKEMLSLEGCDIYSGQAISPDGELMLDAEGQACIQVQTHEGFGVDYIVVTHGDLVLKQQVAMWHDQAEVYLTLLDLNGNPDYGRKWAAESEPEQYVYGIPLTDESNWKNPTEFAVIHLELNDTYGPLANVKVEYEIDEEIAAVLGVVPPVYDEDGNELIGTRSTDLTDADGVSNWVRIACVRDGAANLIATVPGLAPVTYSFQCGDKMHDVVINNP